MKMNDKVYDVLKWVCIIVLPAIATLWFTLGKIWGFPYLAEIEATIIAIDTFLGAILGVSTIQYNRIERK
ncbi:MAG: phage holin [Bacteroidales bacterium]|nr:phage holin [Bacteroidales bacterium]